MKYNEAQKWNGNHTGDASLGHIVQRNIRTLIEDRERDQSRASFSEKIAAVIGRFAGSMVFVYLHLLWFGGWMVYNSLASRWGARPFDPFPFGLLTMIGSLEAIFLSTFVLINQNRMSALAEKRADLDLQVSLLAEHETTAILRMLEQIHHRLGIQPEIPDLPQLEQDVSPQMVLEEIKKTEEQLCSSNENVAGCNEGQFSRNQEI